MKILFISAFPPNKQTAGQNYSRNLLNELAKIASVDLIYFNYKDHLPQIDYRIKIIKKVNVSIVSKILSSFILFNFHPFFSSRFHLSILNFLKKNKDNYQLIYFDFSQVFVYSYFIIHKRKVLMVHDVITQRNERKKDFFSRISHQLLERTEKKVLNSSSERFSFSIKDIELIKDKYGIESKLVSFYIENDIKAINLNKVQVSNFFVFFAAWNRPENDNGLNWFFSHVYPYTNEIKIKIIGPKLSKNLLTIIKKFKNVEYLGFLNNPYEIIASAQALIVPLFEGAGVKVKVIESLSSGTPIIGTSVAFEGIEMSFLHEYNRLANCPEEFVKSLNHYKRINTNDKIKIRDLFLKNYGQNKFTKFL